jgi:hypothetical protein
MSALDCPIAHKLNGFIDVANHTQVIGWASDPDSPRRRVSLLISIDDVLVARVLADEFRQDLFDAGIDDGRHAFAVRLGDGETFRKLCSKNQT